MKKRILLFTAIAGMVAAILTSGTHGAGYQKGYDCTGAETLLGNTNGCSASGCHGATATTGLTVLLELDSAGIATTHYTGGMTYTVKITGTNTTSTVEPVFGFQVSCIEGSTSQPSPANAGAFATTGLPNSVRYTAALPTDFVTNVIEHSDPIAATTGTGGAGTTYVESFSWTAPVAGTGTVSFWGALNAAPGGADTTSTPNGSIWNTTHLVINEWPTSVATVTNNTSTSAFPNPVINNLSLQMDNAQTGVYSLQVFNLNGMAVTTENIAVFGSSYIHNINTINWLPGAYEIVVEKDGNCQVIPVVKM